MFNRTIGDDLAAVQEIEDRAVERARLPGAATVGNAAGSYTGVTSGLIPTTPTPFDLPTDHDGDSGVDIDGNEFYPFIWRHDTFNDNAAYWTRGTAQ